MMDSTKEMKRRERRGRRETGQRGLTFFSALQSIRIFARCEDFAGQANGCSQKVETQRDWHDRARNSKETKAEKLGVEKCSCRTSSERISHTAADRFDEKNAEIAEDAEKLASGVVPCSLRSQRSLRFNSFIESMIGRTTHVSAGRRAQSFFCPQCFCLFLFWLRLGRAKLSAFLPFFACSRLKCPETQIRPPMDTDERR
jgi:hypothetical protein